MRSSLFAVLLACGPSFEPKRAPDPGPTVDAACVDRSRAGTLLDALPPDAAGFQITADKAKGVVYLRRPGTTISDAEGSKLWTLWGQSYFSRAHLSSGSHAIGSVYTCDGVPRPSCFHLSLYLCQTSIAELARLLAAAATEAGIGNAELGADVTVMEARGPACKSGCVPQPHYSTKSAKYDPKARRTPIAKPHGAGRCQHDGECQGGQSCLAWYLSGGPELAYFLQLDEAAFCGCVDRACTFFTQ
jgi:hypothetical protein